MRKERKEMYRNRVNYKKSNRLFQVMDEGAEYNKMLMFCGVSSVSKRRHRAIERIRYRRLFNQPVVSWFSEF